MISDSVEIVSRDASDPQGSQVSHELMEVTRSCSKVDEWDTLKAQLSRLVSEPLRLDCLWRG